jgi:FtsH-binding integral membrane protein
MAIKQDITQGKSLGDLGSEAFWFLTHTLLAVGLLAVMLGAVWMTHPDPDSTTPKLLGTVLAFLVPMVGGFIVAKMQQNVIARYTWISGLLLFSVICVYVLDLPTGNGLCENCGAIEKLWRTFFDIGNGSGLMGGDGLLYGTWLPLAMIGYSVGAWFGLDAD